MAKNKFQTVAVIDVGTNNLKMTVVQVYENGKIVILEDLVKPTMIGSDAFSAGRISVSTMHEALGSLKGFSHVLKEYKIKTVRAVSTSALREAENREYILDHILMHTGIEVEVINSSQEQFYLYKALRYQSPWLGLSKESSLVVNIASGGVEFSIYELGNLKLMDYINIGALRLYEMLSGMENKTADYSRVMEEFVHSRLSFLIPHIRNADIRHFVGIGSEINTVAGLCRPSRDQTVSAKNFSALYSRVRGMTKEQLMETYDLTARQVEILFPTVIILNAFLSLTSCKLIYVPEIELRHGIIYDLADGLFSHPRQEEFQKDIISSVWYIANKYGLEKQHASVVAKMALSIFDQTARYHRLASRERQYLQIAAILHTIAYFVNYSEQNALSYELMRRQNIMGLSDNELDIIANIVYYHGAEVPRQHHTHYQNLTDKDKIVVSKLTAILKLADSLNISRSDAIKQIEISRQGATLVFSASTKEYLPLEEWAFSQKAYFFEEVFGVMPQLKCRR